MPRSSKKKSAKIEKKVEKRLEIEEQEEQDDDDDDVGERLTLDALDAISSSEDEDDGEEAENEEWNAEAQALRQAIADGAFDHLMKKKKKKKVVAEDAVKEVSLEDDDDSDDDEHANKDSDNDEQALRHQESAGKALIAVTEQLEAAKRGMPWMETFDVVTETPLPFDLKTGGNPLDVHDDLKRELAFYNTALDAVQAARKSCLEAKVPFTRPDDFFAEMVKTDDHMAKIKDRLIFENKKMDAFAQRKANQEHKLHAKEAHAHKLAEKSRRKRQHFDALEKWQSNPNMFDNSSEGKINKKRMAADKKYGYGGKRGRFKQTDQRDLNDMSSFRPKGSSGAGMKRGGGGGSKRQGKRARDAARARR